ncbi:MAG: sugar ABC transporter permease, partial [Firmicutes bacterium]|nr:sugar ABC transporter permease [Bacillota bacterium]
VIDLPLLVDRFQTDNPNLKGKIGVAPISAIKKKNWIAYLFILPAMVGIFAVIMVPLVQAIVISFKRYYILDILREDPPFVGLANYAAILSDQEFRK